MRKLKCFASALLVCSISLAQDAEKKPLDLGEIHGNFQIDAQYYNPDSAIGAPVVPEKTLMNAFANIIYTRGNFSAGLRYESYLNTLLGFDPRYKGNAIPFRYATYEDGKLSVTVGSYYEQFGSGLLFRSYEERGLGYDNAMDGVRVKYQPWKGIYLKGLIGKQRFFMEQGPGIVRGFDGEIAFNELIGKWSEAKTKLFLGGSFVSKYQADQDPIYIFPENVGAYGGRFKLVRNRFSLLGEYAYKINDPATINQIKGNYNYNSGHGIYLSSAWSQKGLGITFSAKLIDNMNFRSDRAASGNNLLINFLPALTRQHTYNLAATIYPYATQPNGEISFQGELIYSLKKDTWYGGKYGTTVLINYAQANGLDTTNQTGLNTYSVDWSKQGKLYFSDFNVEINRKLNKQWKMTLFYANFAYNKDVVQGLVGFGTIYSNIEVIDLTYKFSSTKALRIELEGLQTKQDMGDWFAGLLEYSVSPNWFFAGLAQFNYGNPNEAMRLWYPTASLGYIRNATRITLGYGRQRAGIFCVGGICRNVPASNGLTISISSSF
jgi:hypothetical protein